MTDRNAVSSQTVSPPASTSTSSRPAAGRSCLTGVLLLAAYLVGSGLLLMLPTGFIGPVFVAGGFLFVCVAGAHYFLWGRWLTNLLAEGSQRDADGPPT